MSANPLKKPLFGVVLGTALLLLVPAVAMQFTSEVAWGPGDFVVAFLLLFGGGAALLAARRYVGGAGRRAVWTLAIAGAVAVVWAELAVGLFH